MIRDIFPERIRRKIEKAATIYDIEEIRLRLSKNIQIIHSFGELILDEITDESVIKTVFENISGHSLYAWEEELKGGFITLKGGSRVGFCGRALIENGVFKRISEVSSMNIRLSKEVKGCADNIMKEIVSNDGEVLSTLIISPPSVGKTTLIRDIARQLSNGRKDMLIFPHKVVVIDERSEIASFNHEKTYCDVGDRTDILDSCPKSIAIMLAIRTMSPDVIVVDEIGSYEDSCAILEASKCGVSVIATAHGKSITDAEKRRNLNDLFINNAFNNAFVIEREKNKIHIKERRKCVQQFHLRSS